MLELYLAHHKESDAMSKIVGLLSLESLKTIFVPFGRKRYYEYENVFDKRLHGLIVELPEDVIKQ